MHRLKNTVLVIAGSVFIIFLLAILFTSPLVKYIIEKYDYKFIGREIKMNWVYANPFTGYIYLDDLVIYEQESEQEFITMNGLSVNLSLYKLLSKTYEISKIKLNKPFANVIHKDTSFNFTDIIEKFSSDTTEEESNEEIRFNLLNIKIVDGEIHYVEEKSPVNYSIKNVDIKSSGWRYNVDTLPIQFSFSSGIGTGEIEGNMTINLSNLDYKLGVKIDSFDLEVINQYLKDLTNYGSFAAILDADIKSNGNFKSVDSLTTSGKIAISDFHFGKNKKNDFVSFERLVLGINKLSPKHLIYHYDSISLKKPFIRYEKYDSLDNIQTMFGVDGANVSAANADPNKFNLVIEIAKLIEELSQNFLRSHYKVGRFAIYDGDIQYSDYSLGEKFHIALNPFSVQSDSIDKDRQRVKVYANSGIKPHGEFWVDLSVNPKDSSYFDLDYRFHKIPLSMFNPYIKTYTSFPLDRGSMEFVGNWRVRKGDIKSTNHLIIIDPRISKKVRNKDTKWIPVPLAMAILRERGNVIDYEIPITGNLNDPNFNF
jgi:hypothetical protein